MHMAIEDDHQDVLQNIEFIVAKQYKRHPEMTDYEILRTYEVSGSGLLCEARGARPNRPL